MYKNIIVQIFINHKPNNKIKFKLTFNIKYHKPVWYEIIHVLICFIKFSISSEYNYYQN